MDNDLLSKSKLIDWLEEKIESYFLAYHNSYSDYDQGREASYHEVIESVRSGLFDPDPTPSPTIKPGDTRDAEKMLDGVLREIDKLKLYDSNPKAFKRISDIINEEVSHD